MTLSHFLAHRRRWEILAIAAVLLLFASINATSEIIENYRDGDSIAVGTEFALELTSVSATGVLLTFLFYFLRWQNLNFGNLRQRAIWHVPAFVLFSLLHVGLMILLREMVWKATGGDYDYGSLAINLLYEMRRDFLSYLGIVSVYYSYEFILDRLQGEANFLSESSASPERSLFKQQFLVKMLNKEYLVRVDEIESVNSASNYVLLNCGERSYPMRQTMAALSEQLDPARFMRIHRTAIVNLDRVEALFETGELRVRMKSGRFEPVSKTYLGELRQALHSGVTQSAVPV